MDSRYFFNWSRRWASPETASLRNQKLTKGDKQADQHLAAAPGSGCDLTVALIYVKVSTTAMRRIRTGGWSLARCFSLFVRIIRACHVGVYQDLEPRAA